MVGKKIKKTNLLFARDEFNDIINDLISLEIMDIFELTIQADDENPDPQIKTEVIDITEYGANYDSLSLLATESTLYLTGWISAKSEVALITMISKYNCAWEIDTPTSEELKNAPIILARPKFLYRFYSNRRELFSPLRKEKNFSEEVLESTDEDTTSIEAEKIEIETEEIANITDEDESSS